jgi:hypothetical protein
MVVCLFSKNPSLKKSFAISSFTRTDAMERENVTRDRKKLRPDCSAHAKILLSPLLISLKFIMKIDQGSQSVTPS